MRISSHSPTLRRELVHRFADRLRTKDDWELAYEFGDLAFKVLEPLGKNNRFYRLLVV